MEERRQEWKEWADRHDEAMQLLTRIDERVSGVTEQLSDHEGRIRKMEEAAIKQAFVSSGVKQGFWIVVAAILGWAANKWGVK